MVKFSYLIVPGYYTGSSEQPGLWVSYTWDVLGTSWVVLWKMGQLGHGTLGHTLVLGLPGTVLGSPVEDGATRTWDSRACTSLGITWDRPG